MKKLLPIFIIVVLVVGGVSFYGGIKYGESKNPFQDFQRLSSEQRQQFVSRSGGENFPGSFRPVAGKIFLNGKIIKKDNESLTLELKDGGSKIVFFSEFTDVREFVKSSATEIEIGRQITVGGEENPDGSYTAKTIQLGQE